jgi:hypothetical protein
MKLIDVKVQNVEFVRELAHPVKHQHKSDQFIGEVGDNAFSAAIKPRRHALDQRRDLRYLIFSLSAAVNGSLADVARKLSLALRYITGSSFTSATDSRRLWSMLERHFILLAWPSRGSRDQVAD